MASLILKQDGLIVGATLAGRVVIGRRRNSQIMIPDRAVSRIHAWIGNADGSYFVSDTGSRTGTHINGKRLRGRQTLNDGDQIRIGPMKIVFQSNGLPPDIQTLDLYEPRIDDEEEGIFIDCECGAPIWAPADCGGRTGRCRDCGRLVELPVTARDGAADLSTETMAPGMPQTLRRRQAGTVRVVSRVIPNPNELLDPGEVRRPEEPMEASTPLERICGACQSPISTIEQTTTCPECGVVFHTDCWLENQGCSSYGCSQVGILAPPKPAAPPPAPPVAPLPPRIHRAPAPVHSSRHVQWGYLLLPASLLAAVIGLPAFGTPSLLTALGMIGWMVGKEPRSRRAFAVALSISVIGAAVGAAASTYWWAGDFSFRTTAP